MNAKGPLYLCVGTYSLARIYFIWAFEFQRNLHKNLFHIRKKKYKRVRTHQREQKAFFLLAFLSPPFQSVFILCGTRAFAVVFLRGLVRVRAFRGPCSFCPNGFVCVRSLGTFVPPFVDSKKAHFVVSFICLSK